MVNSSKFIGICTLLAFVTAATVILVPWFKFHIDSLMTQGMDSGKSGSLRLWLGIENRGPSSLTRVSIATTEHTSRKKQQQMDSSESQSENSSANDNKENIPLVAWGEKENVDLRSVGLGPKLAIADPSLVASLDAFANPLEQEAISSFSEVQGDINEEEIAAAKSRSELDRFRESLFQHSEWQVSDEQLGAQVLFLPCFIDGFFSNLRIFVASVYLAREFNLTYVGQDFYYKYQDMGRIGGIAGPVNVFEVFDLEFMRKFLNANTQGDFWQSADPLQSPIRDELRFVGIDQGTRCEIKTGKETLQKGFGKFLRQYDFSKSRFMSGRIKSRQNQWKKLEKLSVLPTRSSRFVFSGTPRFKDVLKDYQYTAVYTQRDDLPRFWRYSMETLRFAPRVRELQKIAKRMLGIKPDDLFIAVHIRRGNTYAIGGSKGQAKTDDVADAIRRAMACVNGRHPGEAVSTVYISTLRPYLRKEVDTIQALFPNFKVVGIGGGGDMLNWDTVLPGLSAKKQTILRTSIEMQFWHEADAFCGTRSTMSSFMSLMRVAQAPTTNPDACNRFTQKAWLEASTKKSIP